MARKKYPAVLREHAVRRWRDTQRPVAHVARELGVHPEVLRNWIRQDEPDRDEDTTTGRPRWNAMS